MSKYDNYDSDENREELSNLERIRIFFVKNRMKNLKALIIALVIIIFIFVLMIGAYLIKTLGLINRNEYQGNPNLEYSEEENNDENYPTIGDVYADSIEQYCIEWANTGTNIKSDNVINILLIGRDGDETNSDTIIIASVNTEAKTITLCSVMRDSYTYMDINGSARCDKINHSYGWGGAAALITTLENDLKITIDHYASVNFEGFREIIDGIGGVDVPITEDEANFMNRTTQMGGFTSGDSVHLDGKHALVFARIRHLDSDINRTHRQRLIINAVIDKMKNSSLSQLNSLVNKFLPYVTTDCSNSEILSYASKAISGGWLKFNIEELTEPSENYRKGVYMRTYSSSSSSIWIVDWALVAKEVQLALYGKTNIDIDEATHQSPLDYDEDTGESTTAYDYGTTAGYYYDDYSETSYYETTGGKIFNIPSYSVSIPTIPRYSDSTQAQESTEWSTEFVPDTSVTEPYTSAGQSDSYNDATDASAY